MKILGIETSCDETAAAIVRDGRKIVSNIVASSKDIHDKTGGVIPEVAAREQVRCMIPVLDEAMHKAAKNLEQRVENFGDIDAIAVTVGPGLIGSLLVGVETAKTIAYVTGKPIIPINHIFAHIYANWLDIQKDPEFPAIALVVSGGHTELFLMKNHNSMKWIGGTMDDAAGEAFDKTARLLGLGYPGGPAIAAAADKFRSKNYELRIKNEIKLPRPMIGSKDLNFSFSGLKTAVMREIIKLKGNQQFNPSTSSGQATIQPFDSTQGKQLSKEIIQQLAYEIQEAITDVLVKKTIEAARKYDVKSILLGGGVAANKRLKEKCELSVRRLASRVRLYIPQPNLCTDNAAYIASFAYFHNEPVQWKDTQAQPDLEVEVE